MHAEAQISAAAKPVAKGEGKSENGNTSGNRLLDTL
jgi:hypothetical protein